MDSERQVQCKYSTQPDAEATQTRSTWKAESIMSYLHHPKVVQKIPTFES